MAKPKDAFDLYTDSSTYDMSPWFYQGYSINSQSRLLSELLFADPLLFIACNYHRVMTVKRHYVRHVTTAHPSLTIKVRNYYMIGLTLAASLIRQRAKRNWNKVESNWHPRRALGMSGLYSGLNDTVGTLGTFFSGLTSPFGVSNIPVHLHTWKSSPVSCHCTFDDLLSVAKHLQNYVGSNFVRPSSLSRYGSHVLNSLEYSHDSIDYSLSNVFYQSFPIGRTMSVPGGLRVTITRGDPTSTNDYIVSISGLGNVIIDGSPSNPKPPWAPSATAKIYWSLASTYETNVVIGGYEYAANESQPRSNFSGPKGGLLLAFDNNMSCFSPGLYHTQGKALANLMIDYGKNFENIVQSVEFIELISKIFEEAPQLANEIFGGLAATNASNPLTRAAKFKRSVQLLTELLTGGQLAYAFALAPTVRALKDLLFKSLDFRKGEGAFTITGSGADFSSETPSFRRALLQDSGMFIGLQDSSIQDYEVVFRTTACTSMIASEMAKAILLNNPLAAIGGYPTASSIYEYASNSFVVDWAINVGPMIKDHQAYFSSPSTPLSIGHTVDVRFSSKDGRSFRNFWRSVESSVPIDPPGESWLPLFEFPQIAVPYGIQQLFRIGNKLL